MVTPYCLEGAVAHHALLVPCSVMAHGAPAHPHPIFTCIVLIVMLSSMLVGLYGAYLSGVEQEKREQLYSQRREQKPAPK